MAKRKARRTMKGKAKKKAPALRRAQGRPERRRGTKAASRLRSRQAPKARSTRKAARKPARTAKPMARRKAQAPRLRSGQAKATAPRRRAAAKSSRPKPPGLQRERRRLAEEPVSASVPSSLDFDRSASSAKSGREAMLHHRREHTEAGPSITGGDVDADWEDGYSEGDEAPGGDNPTPDQDVVE